MDDDRGRPRPRSLTGRLATGDGPGDGAGENLALRPGARITAVPLRPTGPGARDPDVLRNETAHRLNRQPLTAFSQDRTYDTYDGPNASAGPDW